MKRIILPVAAILLVALISSCQDETSYMPQIEQMKDSIFKSYPTVGAITIKVEDKTNLKIVLGDERLFAAPADAKRKEGNELGLMAIRIFGKDSYLRTGNLIVTKDLRNSSEAPADGISTPVNIDSLKRIN